ncbi:hypothetical protein Q5741_10115 [Paenibacillus sp. JX-17]|uniref:Uncharacterized protein n=1 Tax=Paenibacillus lacisoli TaxID=3064525 RepID=A0ABT9CGN4_9BACL|nr:hypothetical protein [Paenibacillus sp. JX-17]MDO7906778.1 hypothetical protein [Paenibacillus sp. JX-17]
MNSNVQVLPVETLSVPGNINVDMASASGGGKRRLMVSDNPETLTPQSLPENTGTLWHDVVQTTRHSVKHRIFGWHYNLTGVDVQIGVTVENKCSDRIEVRHIERSLVISPSDGNWLIDVGQKLAVDCIGGTLEAIRPVDPYKFGAGNALLESFGLPAGSLAGFIYEFTVEHADGRGSLDYRVRTVASKDAETDLREITAPALPALPPPQGHPRGVWPFSLTDAVTPVYTVGTSANYRACASKTLSGGVPADLLYRAASSLLEPALDNSGQFGAVYQVTIPIRNTGSETKTVRIRINPRGGAFAGAVRVGDDVYGVPLLRDNTKACRIADLAVAPGETAFTFQFMTGGASSTPLGIYVTTE